MSALPAAAWFPDPSDPARHRWWDGVQWTEHVHPPLQPVAPVAAQQVPVPQQVVEAPAAQQQVATRAARTPIGEAGPGETIIETYYGDEPDRGPFGSPFRMSFRIGFKVGRGRGHMEGIATISQVDPAVYGSAATTLESELARLRAEGMDEDQVQSCMRALAKVESLIEKATSSRVGRKLAHVGLRKLAFSTARGGRGDSLDIVFDGRRYRAAGSPLRH